MRDHRHRHAVSYTLMQILSCALGKVLSQSMVTVGGPNGETREVDLDKLPTSWSLKTNLLETVPMDGDESLQHWIDRHMEPRHAVAVLQVGKGSKRHRLFEELASDPAFGSLLSMAVQFGHTRSYLEIHRLGYASEVYSGKWTRSALRDWLLHMAYPLVNTWTDHFMPAKYINDNPFGVVFVSFPKQFHSMLTSKLEVYAKKYRSRLKFTFFERTHFTKDLWENFGIWTNDEILVLENPMEMKTKDEISHRPSPSAAAYRMENVSNSRIDEFFHAYEAGTWPKYYRSTAPRKPPVIVDGIRELTGWDFVETVQDPEHAVLVEFVAQNCSACIEFANSYKQVAKRVQEAHRNPKSSKRFGDLIVAKIDQSGNDHTEVVISVPYLKYWPRGKKKKSVDIGQVFDIERIWDFIEEHAENKKRTEL